MRARDRSILRLRSLLLATIAGLFLTACDQGNGNKSGAEPVRQPDIVSGYGEKNFAERYHLKLTLPIPEAAFLTILKRLNLQYDVYGERGTNREVPPTRASKFVDSTKMRRVYQIYGGVYGADLAHRVGEMYWAYVDMNGQVVYIENEFSYVSP